MSPKIVIVRDDNNQTSFDRWGRTRFIEHLGLLPTPTLTDQQKAELQALAAKIQLTTVITLNVEN